jgi:hypothetical protein
MEVEPGLSRAEWHARVPWRRKGLSVREVANELRSLARIKTSRDTLDRLPAQAKM